MKLRYSAIFIVMAALLILLVTPAKATHLVGGEVTYKFVGSDNGALLYEISVMIYQDCINGLPEVRKEDDPAYIGIFTQSGTPIIAIDSIPSSEDIQVPLNFSNSCVNNPPATCLRRLTFTRRYRLPANQAMRVIYVRCCRNAAILNIRNPSQVGATYFCDIPAANIVGTNNSAVFKNYPPQIICVNNPLFYDHSATDADGDSLSYEFCDAYPGGIFNKPKPFPSPTLPPPITVAGNNPPSFGYQTGFSPLKPMAGNPVIQINPQTGLISGTPNLQGRYIVSVCCNEWRNGVRINSVHREFQFVVTNCSKAVVANIPQFSEEFNTYIVDCKGKTVRFVNQSKGGFAYDWSFGVPNARSNDFEPTFTYPDTGTYVVSLVVNKGSTCPDSISRFVKIYPDIAAGYEFSGLLCPRSPIQFNDRSDATYKPINKWIWNFGDNTDDVVGDTTPVHSFDVGGTYPVTLKIGTVKGCLDTIVKDVKVEWFVPFAGNDTFIVKGEKINFYAIGGVQFTWTPADRLNITNVNNPQGYYPDTGTFRYNVHIRSVTGCEGDDSIIVNVVNQASAFVPSAFTPNRDGLNDFLRFISVGFAKVNFFRVFNRFGEAVFESDVIGAGWDGTYKGKDAEFGTYFWVLSATDRFGKKELLKGDVILIR